MSLSDRVKKLIEDNNVTPYEISQKTGISQATLSRIINNSTSKPNIKNLEAIAEYFHISREYLVTGKEPKDISNRTETDGKLDTRPRIPLNAAAGSVSIALSGVTLEDTEELPFIHAFSNYSYTILVKGDSMLPEFHSGDELACLQLTNGKASFIQWGRYHVLDTAQGVVVKRIYDNDEYILCKSENNELYPDFKIHKEEIYNIGLVIGMLRRY